MDDACCAHRQAESRRLPCQLRVALIVETVWGKDPRTATIFPVNGLRNLARLMADTELIVANLDVDLVPSPSIVRALQEPAVSQETLEGARAGRV